MLGHTLKEAHLAQSLLPDHHPYGSRALSWPPWLTAPKHLSFGIIANSHISPLPPFCWLLISLCPHPFIGLISAFLCHQPFLSPLLWKECYTPVSFCPSLKAPLCVNVSIFVSQSSKSWLYIPSFIRCSWLTPQFQLK